MGTKYGSENLKVLKDLEPVRQRPGMYIGTTDIQGLHHLIWEIIDNSVDEANEGYGKNIKVTLNNDGSVTVEDEGRGVPWDYNPKEKMTGFDIVYTTLHGGGKFDESNYKTSGGLHGVGGAVVNALSSYMEVHSFRDGADHFMRYEKGGRVKKGPKDLGPSSKRGTSVRFLPDKTIFENINFDYNKIAQHIDESAFLCPGVTFTLYDEASKRKNVYYYKEGIKEYFLKMVNGRELNFSTFYMKDMSPERIQVELCFSFVKNYYDEKILTYANSVKTTEGGHHVIGFKKALTSAFNNYAIKHKLIKDNQKLEGDDIREGLLAIISVRVPEALIQFEGQTKSKLGTKAAATAVSGLLETKLSYYLEEHAREADAIIKKTLDAMSVRKKAKEVRDNERNKGKSSPAVQLSGKLSPCSSKDWKDNELFIVEGDSAGGSAKKARDPLHQAIFPLRGKPKNVSDTTNANEIFENKELATLIYTIGAGSDSNFNIKNIRYNKIIIMTDADDDGSHIQNLLLGFFYQHLRPLVEEGHIYIAVSPLYRVYNKNKEIYCWTEKEREDACKRLTGYKINRYKGLGEMNASQLKETTMNKATRKLIQISCSDVDECKDKIDLFLGKDSDRRKEWISNNIDFNIRDIHFKEVDDGQE